jgi:hypothetical protein
VADGGILSHPELQGLQIWMPATAEAHELHCRGGFSEFGSPEIFMERKDASFGVRTDG